MPERLKDFLRNLVGDQEGKTPLLEPQFEEAAEKTIAWILRFKGVRKALDTVPEGVIKLIGAYGPNGLIAILNGIETKSVLADAVKLFLKEFGNKLGQSLGNNTVDATKAKETVMEELKALKLYVDGNDFLHLPSCLNVRRNAGGYMEVSVEDAAIQDLKAAPCCLRGFAAKAGANPPKAESFVGKSAAYILGSVSPAERKALEDWLFALKDTDRKAAIDAIGSYLDSPQELQGLLGISPEYRIEFLDWLRTDKESAKKSLEQATEIARKGARFAWGLALAARRTAAAWDKRFKSAADEAETEFLNRKRRKVRLFSF